MGDKTQLLAFALSTRYRRPWTVMAGIVIATVLNHALASATGAWISAHVPLRAMAAILAILFFVFALWALRPDSLEESATPERFGPFLTTAVLFFLAEMGDKTQLATAALAARYQSIARVTLGTTLGMIVSDGLAVALGERLAARVGKRWIRIGAASLFLAFAAVSAWTAWRPADA
jgi:putative Ca2+/H+ antiporter (TMEM165/GDT1 family)